MNRNSKRAIIAALIISVGIVPLAVMGYSHYKKTSKRAAATEKYKAYKKQFFIEQTALLWCQRAEVKAGVGKLDVARDYFERCARAGAESYTTKVAGHFIYERHGMTRDLDLAENLAQNVSDKLRAKLLYDIAQFYKQNHAQYPQASAKMEALLDASLKAGFGKAGLELAHYYGYEAPIAPEKALTYFDKVIALNNSKARFEKATFLLDDINGHDMAYVTDGLAELQTLLEDRAYKEKAAEALGDYYLSDTHKTPDYEKVARYYGMLQYPKPITQVTLGHLYRTSLGGTQDWDKAMAYYETGARANIDAAHMMLGHIYRLGLTGVVDPQKAKTYYEKIGTDERRTSGHYLGHMYQRGALGPVDMAAATAAYKAGIAANVPAASVMMARLYEGGQGVPRSPERARELMLYAGETGSNLGSAGLADYYTRGFGGPANTELAESWRNKIRKDKPPLELDCDICDVVTD